MSEGEQPSAIWERFQRARKPHKCCECYAEILPGDRYQVVSGVWGGEFSNYKSCSPCAWIRNTMRDGGEASCFTELKEAMEYSSLDLSIPAMVVLGMQAG
jgi:hypothetical protein